MCVLDFLSQNHNIEVLHYNHATERSNAAENFLIDYCEKNKIKIFTETNKKEKPKKKSFEEFWREQRYDFFSRFDDKVIVTAHHLNDAVEWWIFSSLNGQSKIMNYSRGNIIRPFLTTSKHDFEQWQEKRSILFIEDPSNQNIRFARNRIRKNILPEVLLINPGILKNIKRKIVERFNKNDK
jgi:tRNA(Ile)-lysidine synthase